MSGNERRTRKPLNPPSTEHSGRTTPTSVDSWSKETPVDYLFKNNVTAVMTESINHLIMNRPDDPIRFLVDYFASSSYDVVNEAYMKLSWSHFMRKSYQRNILEVYDTLVSVENGKSNLCGLLGKRFNELLRKLTDDLPQPYGQRCYVKVKSRDAEVIVFDRFYHAVLLLHVMKDFIRTVQDVYRDIDFANAGRASEVLCSIVLSRLSGHAVQGKTDDMDLLEKDIDKMSLYSSVCKDKEVLGASLIRELQESSDLASEPSRFMEEQSFVEKAVQIILDMV